MFDLNLWRGSSDESRRDVLERLAKLAFGVSVFPLLPARLTQPPRPNQEKLNR